MAPPVRPARAVGLANVASLLLPAVVRRRDKRGAPGEENLVQDTSSANPSIWKGKICAFAFDHMLVRWRDSLANNASRRDACAKIRKFMRRTFVATSLAYYFLMLTRTFAATASTPAIAADASRHLQVKMNTEAIIRIIISSLMGSALGLETSSSTKHQTGAGKRTMALVSLGACVFTICGTQGFALQLSKEVAKGTLPNIEHASVDASRMASTILTGVGFIGAGVISTNRMPDGRFDRESAKRGLIVAATIWMASAIGSSIGAGLYFPALSFLLCATAVLRLGELFDADTTTTADKTKATDEANSKYNMQNGGENPVLVDDKKLGLNAAAKGDKKSTTHVPPSSASWLESIKDDSVQTSPKEHNAKASNTYSSSSSSKKIDRYVDKFIRQRERESKDLQDDDENESQQIIW